MNDNRNSSVPTSILSTRLPSLLPILDPVTLSPGYIWSPAEITDSCASWAAVLLRIQTLDEDVQREWIVRVAHSYTGTILLNSTVPRDIPGGWFRHYPERVFRSGTNDNSREWGGSVHTLAAMQALIAAGGYWALVSPVRETASHPGQAALAADERAQIIFAGREAGVGCWGLGGVRPADLSAMQQLGFAGVAGIRGFWQNS